MSDVPTLARLCRYPVKGMSAHDLDSAMLSVGKALPHDRRFAIAHGSTTDLPPDGGWAPKANFVTLVNCAKLAGIEAVFEPESGHLTLKRNGRQVARADITTPLGRTIVEDFLRAYLAGEVRGALRLIEAKEDAFTDSRDGKLSLINLASIRDLERVTGHPVDPIRFRGNLYVEGLPAWAEFGWTEDTEIRLGEVALKLYKRIGRCAATNVNPQTAERDANLPLALRRGFGHFDMGVYLQVTAPGTVRVGDTLTVS